MKTPQTLTLNPPGYTLFPSLQNPQSKTLTFHQITALFITFAAYASFHASRKPPSIVKSILGPDPNNPNDPKTGWAPFNTQGGPHRLGELDLAFLAAYAVGMYLSGLVGDRIDVRVFLSVGMVGSGVFTVMFGLGYWFDVHLFAYYVVVQICCGVFESVGWPCVVAVMGNWFGKRKRGLIMGVWNSHTSVGNIVGSIVASSVLGFGWGWAFVLPGLLIVVVSVFVFLFLVVNPESIGLELPQDDEDEEASEVSNEGVALVNVNKIESEGDAGNDDIEQVSESSAAIGFFEAWKLPGVAPFAFCLFFSKLVAYTFLYWLPFYIRHTAVAGVQLSHKTAGILSTIFDIGGVIGGILAGYTSDLIEARAVTSFIFLLLSVPALVFYRLYGSISMFSNIFLMFLSGLLVNGPYALITTAVAADLGTQSSIKGNSRALATVSAIIDGTGSVGAALGPLLAGYISTRGWNSVFFMLILSLTIAGLLLVRVVRTEIRGKVNEGKWLWLSGIAL
ncbi:putative glycerol-3-phosphate transporter 5 [Tanacetum coccineum]|uniref:Glycerol-3-phosphate transporter 5 n=1 Tax=Tanacetum coccineum TaxID=301880 RepID=A0ABQ5HHX4_9ASTR